MREARNDLALYSNAAVIALATHQDAFSLSEAGYQSIMRQQKPPVCVRFAHLDWVMKDSASPRLVSVSLTRHTA